MPGFTLVEVRASVRKLIRDTGTTKVFPNDPDFDEPFIRQAVQEYSERKPRRRPFYELQLQAGTGEYALPEDWMRVDETSWGKVMGAPAGRYEYKGYPVPFATVLPSIPFPPTWLPPGGEVRFLDDEQMLYIHPAPRVSAALVFDYWALHAIDAADKTKTTAKVTDQTVIEKLAAAIVLEAIAVEQAFLTKYKLARGLEVDNSQVSDELKDQAKIWRGEAFAQMTGPVLMRG
jgi:hypothetical protein